MRVRATNTNDIPPWLNVMRAITGTKEAPGDEDNPAILAMADEIARLYPDMEAYCASYQHDETPWCGLATGYACATSGIRPPFGATDTDKFLWAQSFDSDPHFYPLPGPVIGCIVVLVREGGGHVTLFESDAGGGYINCRGGNQSDAINVKSFSKSDVIAYVWPEGVPLPYMPPDERPVLRQGSSGPYVASVQTSLGIVPVDGDFGSITDGGVRGYQAAYGIGVDGEVGPQTWGALDDLDTRKAEGTDGLDHDTIERITGIAENSAIARYNWRDRGQAPYGYTAGIACAFALALRMLDEEGTRFQRAAQEMAQAERDDPDTDVLSWYADQFDGLGMSNSRDGVDTLRHLFVLMLGLGPRESSGRYPEGRDMSADNVTSDTAEAGMYQTSWNIATASASIPPLLPAYWSNPNGFLATFQNGVSPDSNDLGNFGTGDGAKYQFLSKYAPAFHAFVTALGLRYRRNHWGPVNREEVELRSDADTMLREVQTLMEGGEPQPEPTPPEIDTAKVLVVVRPKGTIVNVVGGADPDSATDEAVSAITVTVDPPGSALVNVRGASTRSA
jgi:uncharacterized protein (TIGR02594 family)